MKALSHFSLTLYVTFLHINTTAVTRAGSERFLFSTCDSMRSSSIEQTTKISNVESENKTVRYIITTVGLSEL